MIYKVGGKVISKKAHACGGNNWTIMRTGADIKLKCDKCGHQLFVSVDQLKKMSKSYTDNSGTDNVD